jgi:hypothetical protein
LIETLEKICFKGKTHLKRGIGFTSIPDILKRGLNYDIEKVISDAFLKTFGKNVVYKPKIETQKRKPKLVIVENLQN